MKTFFSLPRYFQWKTEHLRAGISYLFFFIALPIFLVKIAVPKLAPPEPPNRGERTKRGPRK